MVNFKFLKKILITFFSIIIMLIIFEPISKASPLDWFKENITNNPYNGYVAYDGENTLKYIKKIDGISTDKQAKDAIIDAIASTYQIDDREIAKEIFNNADENELKIHIYQMQSETATDRTIMVEISEAAQEQYGIQKSSNPYAGKNYQESSSGGGTPSSTPQPPQDTSTEAQGTKPTSLDDIISNGKSFLQLGATGGKINENELKTLSSFVSSVLLWIAIAVTLISAIVMGINFLTQSVEDKAKIKESMTPWVIGIIISFGAYTIWQITIKLLSSL